MGAGRRADVASLHRRVPQKDGPEDQRTQGNKTDSKLFEIKSGTC